MFSSHCVFSNCNAWILKKNNTKILFQVVDLFFFSFLSKTFPFKRNKFIWIYFYVALPLTTLPRCRHRQRMKFSSTKLWKCFNKYGKISFKDDIVQPQRNKDIQLMVKLGEGPWTIINFTFISVFIPISISKLLLQLPWNTVFPPRSPCLLHK